MKDHGAIKAKGRTLAREEVFDSPTGEDRDEPRGKGRPLTRDEVLALPVAFDLVTAGRAWDLGRTKSHELARAGEFPCPVLRIGSQYRVTRADLLRSLGIEDPGQPFSAALDETSRRSA
ncbi:hypothetical protein [Actinomadura macra]|uniref:hypothetical protein n=1 Tax=Actinomadura macra TaxID=46164 RepID=UPI000A98E15C|nr:hypothetical protein [Actinomadura macra]